MEGELVGIERSCGQNFFPVSHSLAWKELISTYSPFPSLRFWVYEHYLFLSFFLSFCLSVFHSSLVTHGSLYFHLNEPGQG